MTLDVKAPIVVYIAIDAAELTAALSLATMTSSTSPPLALATLLFINAQRLAAYLVDSLQQTSETPTNGPNIVALHKRILCILIALVLADVVVTFVIADRLEDDTPPFALMCAMLAITQLGRLWRIVAHYSIETFDRYASTTGLAQSRKYTLVTSLDVCFHAFQLLNGLGCAALITMFYRGSTDYALRYDTVMLMFIVGQIGGQVALDIVGVVQQIVRHRRRAVHMLSLVDCLSSAGDEKTADADVCVICRDEYANSDTDNVKLNSTIASRTQLSCGHVFHRDCLALWLPWSLYCPMCRTPCVSVEDDDRVKPAPLLCFLTLYT